MNASDTIERAHAFRAAACMGDYANAVGKRDSDFWRWRMLDAMRFVTWADLSDEMDEARMECTPAFNDEGYLIDRIGYPRTDVDELYCVPFERLTLADAERLIGAARKVVA